MSERQVEYQTALDNQSQKCDMIDAQLYVKVYRADLEAEHSILIARVNQIRKQLGYPPLLTGKEVRRQQQR